MVQEFVNNHHPAENKIQTVSCPNVSLLCTKQERQSAVSINVILRNFRETFVAVEKQYVLRIASLSVALVIQQAKRMRPVISSPVACLAV